MLSKVLQVDPDVFTSSSLNVRDNAVKNILFRAATLIFQFVIYRVFSFLAYRSNAYTSFLMFAEDMAQKLFFVFSRKFNRQALLVLGFAVLTAVFGFYDTLLWALDSPGYIVQTSTVNGSSLSSELLANPAYITFIANPSGRLDDIEVSEAMQSNLFKTGFNFSLPTTVTTPLGKREVVAPSQDDFLATGARIWLDDEGFSVAIDQDSATTTSFTCDPQLINEATLAWNCRVNNTEALELAQTPLAQPQIWWDTASGQSEFLRANRKDNPWQSLSTGGDTAVMKEVFTATKGKRRHTFLQSAFKTTLLTAYPTPFDASEVSDLVRRTWQTDPTQPIDAATQALVNRVLYSQGNGTSLTFGVILKDAYSVSVSSIEALNILNAANNVQLYTLLRVSSSNITLIRTETLDKEVTSIQPNCQAYNTNVATGGKVRSSTCSTALGTRRSGHFTGQLDASSMVILSDIIGDGSSNKSAVAFNQTGVDWFNANEDAITQRLISRAVILGGDASVIQVEVKHAQPAISYLQLFLTLFPILFALVAWAVTFFSSMSYYQSSLLSALSTTTHIVPTKSCKKVGYLRVPPDIILRTDDHSEHVTLGTSEGGSLLHVQPNQVVALAMTTEPLYAKEGAQFTPAELVR